MGAKSQIKGASGEREFCKVLGNLIGIDCLERNLEQRRSGGHDINVNQAARPTLLAHERETLDRLNQLAIEIKRHRSATGADIGQWWSQTCRQAAAISKSPILAFRTDRGRWQIIAPCSLERPLADMLGTIRMDIELFAEHLLAGAQTETGDYHVHKIDRESVIPCIQSNY